MTPIAAWFLVQEAWRGKKRTPALTLPQVRAGLTSLLRERRADVMKRSGWPTIGNGGRSARRGPGSLAGREASVWLR